MTAITSYVPSTAAAAARGWTAASVVAVSEGAANGQVY